MDLTIADVKTFFEKNKDSDEVKQFTTAFDPWATAETGDQIYELTGKYPKVKEYMLTLRNKAIEDYRKKNFDKEYQDRYNKDHPPEDERDKRIQAIEAELKREKLEKTALELATIKKISPTIAKRLIADTEEATANNIAEFHQEYVKEIQAQVEARIKEMGRPTSAGSPKTQPAENGLYTRDQLAALGPEEQQRNWEKVKASMAALYRK